MDYKNILDNYTQQITVLAILCTKTSKYYNRKRHCLIIPNIIITSMLTILNAVFENTNHLKIANVILNASSTLLIALDKSLQYSEKATLFFKSSQLLSKLSHDVDRHRLNAEVETEQEFLKTLINDYDNIVSNITYEVPNSIITSVSKAFDCDIRIPLVMMANSNMNLKRIQITSNKNLRNVNKSTETEIEQHVYETKLPDIPDIPIQPVIIEKQDTEIAISEQPEHITKRLPSLLPRIIERNVVECSNENTNGNSNDNTIEVKRLTRKEKRELMRNTREIPDI